MQYGRYTDDSLDEYGPSRSLGTGSDRDPVSTTDPDDEEPESQPHAPEGGGRGRERRDVRAGSELMPMTRRDPVREARALHQNALDDMRSFLDERETGPDPMHSVSSVAVTGLELAIGAAGAAFLAQRFRQAGALIPVGVTLGVLGVAAAQFNLLGKYSPDLRNVSFGAGVSAIALWAAGRGIIANEAVAAPNAVEGVGVPPGGVGVPATGARVAPQQQQPQQQQHQPPLQYRAPSQQQHVAPARVYAMPMPVVPPPYVPQPYGQPARVCPMPMPIAAQPMVAISMADFQNLVARRVA